MKTSNFPPKTPLIVVVRDDLMVLENARKKKE
jgi:hypothetical protein